jgi:hypothetical protein
MRSSLSHEIREADGLKFHACLWPEKCSENSAMTKLAVFVATAALFVAGCNTQKQKVQQDNSPSGSEISPPPHPAGQPLASVPDGTQTNIGNQANASQPTTNKK